MLIGATHLGGMEGAYFLSPDEAPLLKGYALSFRQSPMGAEESALSASTKETATSRSLTSLRDDTHDVSATLFLCRHGSAFGIKKRSLGLAASLR
jgi:hypothetical protein